jgi:hypothetical protein
MGGVVGSELTPASARSDCLSQPPPYTGGSHEGPSVSATLATETKFWGSCGASCLAFGRSSLEHGSFVAPLLRRVSHFRRGECVKRRNSE